MPPALELDEKHAFTWSCLLSATENGGKIDFGVVAAKHGCTSSAASQRFGKMKKTLNDDGSLVKKGKRDTEGESGATNGTPSKKRGRPKGKGNTPVGDNEAKKLKLNNDHQAEADAHSGEEDHNVAEQDDESENERKYEGDIKEEFNEE